MLSCLQVSSCRMTKGAPSSPLLPQAQSDWQETGAEGSMAGFKAPWMQTEFRNHTSELRPTLWKTQLLSCHFIYMMFGGSRSGVPSEAQSLC